MNRDMKAWKEAQIASPVKRAMPILSFPAAGLLGVGVGQLVADAGLQARGMKRIADRVDACAAVSFMDLSVEAEAFGAQAVFQPGEVPTVTGVLVPDEAAARALRVPAVGAGRTGTCVEAIRQASALITDRPVLAGVIGPYSLAGRLMGVSDIMILCYDDPDSVHAVLGKVTEFLCAYVLAFRAAGADGVVIAEPLAGLLSPALADEFSSPYAARIVAAAQSRDFLAIYHNCGNNVPLMLEGILATGAEGFHFGDAVDMGALVGRVPADRLVMGNISPSALFLSGTPQRMREETTRLLEACAPGHPNFIISSGCDIPPRSPWENIDAFFEAVAAYYRRP